jgi:glutathione reductase (NADPH)
MLPRLLDNFDADAVTQLRGETERIGVAIHTGVEVRRIERAANLLRVVYVEDGSERSVEADRVVNGAGRLADLDALDLPAGRVEAGRGRIALDRHLRSTSNPAVYVCGDAAAVAAQLSPIATYQGRIVGRNIVDGPRHVPDYTGIASCVFTVPALASVGLTQAAAERQGIDLDIKVNDMHEWLSGRTYALSAAWSKLLIDKRTDRIVGAHLFGHAGEELIHMFGLAMKHGITASQIRDFVYGSRPSPPTSNRCFEGPHSLPQTRVYLPCVERKESRSTVK